MTIQLSYMPSYHIMCDMRIAALRLKWSANSWQLTFMRSHFLNRHQLSLFLTSTCATHKRRDVPAWWILNTSFRIINWMKRTFANDTVRYELHDIYVIGKRNASFSVSLFQVINWVIDKRISMNWIRVGCMRHCDIQHCSNSFAIHAAPKMSTPATHTYSWKQRIITI